VVSGWFVLSGFAVTGGGRAQGWVVWGDLWRPAVLRAIKI
jgi:hypothetical protein